MNFSVPRKLQCFLTTPKRYKIAIGGRGSGKSTTFANLLLHFGAQYGEKILCMREYQSSIEDSCMALLADQINEIDIPGYKVDKTSIVHDKGGLFKFKGLARSIESVKSYHGFQKGFIEEAQFLSQDSIRILKPTFRTDGSEIWMAANPGSSSDPFSKSFLMPYWDELLTNGYYEDDMYLIVVMNYMDNPFFPAVLKQERKADAQSLPQALYDHIWLGHFNDTVENAIIQTEWFDAAIDAHKKLGFSPTGMEVVAHDPSDSGPDNKGLAHRHGSVLLECMDKDTGDSNEGMDWALEYTIQNQVDLFVWDCDGMGVALNRQVERALTGKHIDYVMYKGSNTPDDPGKVYEGSVYDSKKHKTNKHTFKNKRAQKNWLIRDRFYNTWLAVKKGIFTDPDKMISISSKIKKLNVLRSEACRIPRKSNPNGLIQLYTKREMRDKLKIKSPNMFDSLVMAFEDTVKINNTMNLEFEGWER